MFWTGLLFLTSMIAAPAIAIGFVDRFWGEEKISVMERFLENCAGA
jgi:hypothetical protein